MEAYRNNRPLDQQPPQETIAYVPQPEIHSTQVDEVDETDHEKLLGQGVMKFITSRTVFEPVIAPNTGLVANTEYDDTNPSIILSID